MCGAVDPHGCSGPCCLAWTLQSFPVHESNLLKCNDNSLSLRLKLYFISLSSLDEETDPNVAIWLENLHQFFFFATEKHDCRNGHAHLFCLHIPASFAIWDYFLIFSASTIAQRLYILAICKDADGLFFPFN
jgi:hypothetical protein